jgi:hypothetical protein
MTWGYWGIVTGLAVLLLIFFACMEILYHRTGETPAIGEPGSPTGGHGAAIPRKRRAA